jgi:hypothetical protein
MAELIKKSKQAGMPLQSAPAPEQANVINLMDALRAHSQRQSRCPAEILEGQRSTATTGSRRITS